MYIYHICVLAIVNSASMNIGVHVSFWITVFIFSGYILYIDSKGAIAVSYGSFTFSF